MIYFWQMGMFVAGERFFKAIVQNNSSSTSYFSIMVCYAILEADVWRSMIEHYFRVIKEEMLK